MPLRGSWSKFDQAYGDCSEEKKISILPSTSLVIDFTVDVSFGAVRLGMMTDKKDQPSACRLQFNTSVGYQKIADALFTRAFLVFDTGDTENNAFLKVDGPDLVTDRVFTVSSRSFSDMQAAEKAKADADRAEADRAEADRVAAEKAKADADRAEADRVAAEKAKADADRAEADRVAAEKAKADADRAEADRAAAEKAKADAARAEADRAAAEKAKADEEARLVAGVRWVMPSARAPGFEMYEHHGAVYVNTLTDRGHSQLGKVSENGLVWTCMIRPVPPLRAALWATYQGAAITALAGDFEVIVRFRVSYSVVAAICHPDASTNDFVITKAEPDYYDAASLRGYFSTKEKRYEVRAHVYSETLERPLVRFKRAGNAVTVHQRRIEDGEWVHMTNGTCNETEKVICFVGHCNGWTAPTPPVEATIVSVLQ
jgi:flagellar biosynthesis GTPase FlhF